jgi:ribose transport system ATP-binding protein
MSLTAQDVKPPVVLKDVSKHFGGAKALDHASLTISAGEIHGLLGENGSGKSTLIKVLAGFHAPDSGELLVNGEPIVLPMPPGTARQLGIGFVHQDLGLIPSLTILDNLRIGSFAAKASWRVSWRGERHLAKTLLDEYGLDVDPSATVESLRPTEKAMLAIVRAVQDIRTATSASNARGLLVLDETTVFLPADEKQHLFRVVREIASKSASVLFVSHDLDEVLEITDNVTVLRDGRVQGTVATRGVSIRELVQMIVGRAVEFVELDRRDVRPAGSPVVITDLTIGKVTYPRIEAHRSEVLGLTGLPGTGFDRVLHALFGSQQPERGTLELDGRVLPLDRLQPGTAVRAGIGFLPGDRLNQGSVGSLPVEDNVLSPILSRFRSPLGLNRRAMTRAAGELMDQFDVRPRDPSRPLESLSGGNQQKALVGKWLQLGMRLWLVEEPTQGVDIGARQQIFREIREAAQSGTAVICASNDHEQLALICDQVLVFGFNGRTRALEGSEINKQNISAACFDIVGTAHDNAGIGVDGQ